MELQQSNTSHLKKIIKNNKNNFELFELVIYNILNSIINCIKNNLTNLSEDIHFQEFINSINDKINGVKHYNKLSGKYE